MKLVKFVPAVAATLVLAACSSSQEVAPAAATLPQVQETVVNTPAGEVTKVQETLATQNKSVVYRCKTGGTVTANYAFHNGEIKGVNLRVGKKNEITGFAVDAAHSQKTDSTVFTSGDFVWVVDSGLNFANAEKTEANMLYKKSTHADQIVAKNCKINQSATARLNK